MTYQSVNTSMFIKKYITTEYITVVTFLIYGCGIIYNYIYYKGFGINITKYLSLQETFVDTSIFITVLVIISAIFIPTGYYIAFWILMIKKNNRIRRYIAITRRIRNMYFLNFLKYWMVIDYILAFLAYIIFVSGYTVFNININIFLQFFISLLGISTLIKTSILSQFRKDNILINANYFIISFIIISSIYIIALMQTERILTNKSIKKEVISLISGEKYTTNDSILYIGETTSTIFLFNKPLNNTIIINKSNVVQTLFINQATIKIKKGATN